MCSQSVLIQKPLRQQGVLALKLGVRSEMSVHCITLNLSVKWTSPLLKILKIIHTVDIFCAEKSWNVFFPLEFSLICLVESGLGRKQL